LVAIALAPLSVVQAYAAGGVAVSLPVAAGALGYSVTKRQLVAILLVSVSLASLPLALHSHSHLHTRRLSEVWLLVLPVAAVLGVASRPPARAVSAGMFYGVADAAIKAAFIGRHGHLAALLSAWAVVAAAATFCGFLCFQAALRAGTAVTSISLMNAFATLVALVLGVVAFGESLGATPAAIALHVLAITLVLGCVPLLANGSETERESIVPVGPPRVVILGIAAIITLLASVLVGAGLLYGLRDMPWLAAGPRIGDALPLLQLAGFDGQPLGRVVLAFLAAGMVFGATQIRTIPRRRAALAGMVGLLMLLMASDATLALTRNLRFGPILWHRAPTIGCWVEAVALAIGAAIPRSSSSMRLPRPPGRKTLTRAYWPIPTAGAAPARSQGGASRPHQGLAAALRCCSCRRRSRARSRSPQTRPQVP
jgi:hypothetical protein